jgi:PAS domain-containing protein
MMTAAWKCFRSPWRISETAIRENEATEMSSVPSDTSQSSRRNPIWISAGAIAKAARLAVGLRENGHVFELPARLFEQLPFAIYICDRDGLVLRYNRRAAELWGRAPKLGDPNERFCGSYRMYRPDGSPLPHHECPMADVLRSGISVRQQEVHIERPDGSRGIALVDIEAVKDGDGNIIGAVNCFQDITERKRAEEREKMLAGEVDHRAKNLLALVQAAVQLTHADTVKDFKAAIQGRLQALSNAHSLLAITLGGSRPAQSDHGRTCSLLRSGNVARGYQRSYPRFGAKIGTVDGDGSARVDDERGQIWGSVGSFGSASS